MHHIPDPNFYKITDKDILYEDNHLIAVYKKAGWIVQVDDTNDP
ncbi:MAG TPA: RNA pseudouridine synthase, partial [Pelobium sp.]